MPRPLRVAVIGVGYLGALHARIYSKIKGIQLISVCDTDLARARQVASTYGCRAVGDFRELLGTIDAASLAVPTRLHYPLGRTLLRHGIHLLIEKPIATRLRDASELLRIATRRRCILQVGHVERFNAAIRQAAKYLTRPRFIECHRLAPFTPRGADVSVVLDLMIHDLDIILALVRTPVRRVEAVGLRAVTRMPDLVNARLTFAQGTIADLTTSRISDETMRKIRIFQDDAYFSIDSVAQTVEVARRVGGRIHRQTISIRRGQPLRDELRAFVACVRQRRRPLVSGAEATDALALALRIDRAVRRRLR